jgi:hypothetical protein
MPTRQRIQARQRQRIRALVAETRGVAITEIAYPRSNALYIRYLFEAGVISRHQYEHAIYMNYYPYALDIRNSVTRPQNFLRIININNERLIYRVDQELDFSCINWIPNYRRNQNEPITYEILEQQLENVQVNFRHNTNYVPITHERLIRRYGERLAETNNNLCQECLMPITLGEILCEECHQEA